jgi:hypothetical protein
MDGNDKWVSFAAGLLSGRQAGKNNKRDGFWTRHVNIYRVGSALDISLSSDRCREVLTMESLILAQDER